MAGTWTYCDAVSSNVAVDWGRFGSFVKSLGDINSDGYDELAIANDRWDNSRLEIYGGVSGGLLYSKTFSESETVGSVEIMGDYNGDSIADLEWDFTLLRQR